MQADPSELRHHIRPEELPPLPSWRPVLIVAAASGVAALLALAGWTRYRRRQSPVPIMAPRERIRTELARLELLPLGTPGDVARFHICMADLVRRYLQLLCGLSAFELTTPEILVAIDRLPTLSPGERVVIRGLLERCDIVKFAGALPAAEECRQMMKMAQTLVTEPIKEVSPITEGHGTERP
jgi:hypothetical protein